MHKMAKPQDELKTCAKNIKKLKANEKCRKHNTIKLKRQEKKRSTKPFDINGTINVEVQITQSIMHLHLHLHFAQLMRCNVVATLIQCKFGIGRRLKIGHYIDLL